MTASDAVWSEEGTTPDAIEAALRKLLAERHAESGSYVPARVLNMIAFVDDEWSGEIANRLRGVGRYAASRLVVLSYEPGRTRLDARASIAADQDPEPGQIALLHETVIVRLGERHLGDLLTIADPLVVTDLPTLLWSPHGHPEAVDALLSLAQATLVDSIEESVWRDALDRASELAEHLYVVDLAWLRSTPWRERVAATFDPPQLRPELHRISELSVRHHPESGAAALLFCGWLASRLGWHPTKLVSGGGGMHGKARARRDEVALKLEPDNSLSVRGLAGIEIATSSGMSLALDRGAGGLRATRRGRDGKESRWTVLGASRGEGGIIGEGVRQALLRDPTYAPALDAARVMVA
jgi:glucose-6-phosphate dehydrogenase assembly protein OpcA